MHLMSGAILKDSWDFCAIAYLLVLHTFICPHEFDATNFVIFLIFQGKENRNSQQINNLPKLTQLSNSGSRVTAPKVWFLNLFYYIPLYGIC